LIALQKGVEWTDCEVSSYISQAYQLGPEQAPNYALEGAIAIAGAGVSWLRDKLQVITDAADSEAVGSSVQDTGGAHTRHNHTQLL
jgi:glycerol kinase